MNVQEARKVAQEYISEKFKNYSDSDHIVLNGDHAEEFSDGWYFFYQSERFLETGDMAYSLVGNWPIFVSKEGACFGPRRPPSLGEAE